MTVLSRFGLTVDLPWAWEGAIFQRPVTEGESPHPVVHCGTFALPPDRGDFGSGAVETMTANDVFLALLEYDGAFAGRGLYAADGVPWSLDASMFSTGTLQRVIAGQAGTQRFFTAAGRAFCLYVVLGSASLAGALIPSAVSVLRAITVAPR
ncbi:MAG TPA: hypothetical protein VHN98_09620 [Acidimicrobiales bacterium]|nr:hypothetical protein [Acidimicrobiales bacterium]